MNSEQITQVLNEQIAKIQPVLTAHGGGVEIIQATEEKVILGLKGHCAGCPLAPVTFGLVLKKYITEALPDLKNIQYVDMNLVEKLISEGAVNA